MNPGGSQEGLGPDEQKVWIEPKNNWFCYIRLGQNANLATVNFPAESPEAEVARKAFSDFYSPSAKTGASVHSQPSSGGKT